jgi:hypothetical protein
VLRILALRCDLLPVPNYNDTDLHQLTRADQIVTELGGGADAIAAAQGLVAAEKNTNPGQNGNAQNVCSDPTLPVTPELRGITPLIDPAVDVDGAAAALSQQSLGTPLNADGMSVFDLMDAAGLGALVNSQAAAGGAAAGGAQAGGAQAGGAQAGGAQAGGAQAGGAQAGGAQAGGAQAGGAQAGGAQQGQNANKNKNQGAAAGNNNQGAANKKPGAAAVDDSVSCNDGAAAGNATQNGGQDNQQQNNNNANANTGKNQASGGAAAGQQNAASGQQNAAAGQQNAAAGQGGADFGACTPTLTFQGGEGNRPATEFTFQIADPVARGGQGEALNPNIITNALCNQLTNVCSANEAAVSLCEDAKAQVEAAGTRNKSTADLFNTAIGFPGAVTNPAGGPDDVPAAGAGAAAAARKMRRGMRN